MAAKWFDVECLSVTGKHLELLRPTMSYSTLLLISLNYQLARKIRDIKESELQREGERARKTGIERKREEGERTGEKERGRAGGMEKETGREMHRKMEIREREIE